MKIGMLILGIIGALVALIGSVVTMIGGFGGTAVGAIAENSHTANNGAYVFWSGAIAVFVSALALITSITGGVAKKKNSIFTFALGTLLCGLLSIYLYNWFSGTLIAIAGILGMVGAKEGIDDQTPLKKSVMLYIVLAVILVVSIVAAVFKNGTAIIEGNKASADTQVTTEQQQSSPVQNNTSTAPTTGAYVFENPVELKGTALFKDFDDEGKKGRYPELKLASPIDIECDRARVSDCQEEKNVAELQLTLTEQQMGDFKALEGKQVTVKGNLFHAMTGGHYTNALIMVNQINP